MFVAPDGNIQEVMCCDYGFRSGFGRLYQGGDGEIPKSALALVRSCSAVNWRTHCDPPGTYTVTSSMCAPTTVHELT